MKWREEGRPVDGIMAGQSGQSSRQQREEGGGEEKA